MPTLSASTGEIVRRGVKALTGLEIPVFHKRRFQEDAMPAEALRRHVGEDEGRCRQTFHSLDASGVFTSHTAG